MQAQVLKLLREIRDIKSTSILFITHDLGIVAGLCDWVYVMRNGAVVENGPVERIFVNLRQIIRGCCLPRRQPFIPRAEMR